MKSLRLSDSQIMAILKQNESGAKVSELCREHGMSQSTFYKWRAKYGGIDASFLKEMKELRAENARLNACMRKRKLSLIFAKRRLRESCKAIRTQTDGSASGDKTRREYSCILLSVSY